MFERLQKPFLTVETGEAYQPIRLTYDLRMKDELIETLNHLKCCEKNPSGNSWNWFWKGECDELHFESLDTFKKNPDQPLRLGSIAIRNNTLYLSLPSFKRACLAVPFFFNHVKESIAKINKADFINKVFGLDERLPHGFTELFKEEELEKIVHQREVEFAQVQENCEDATSAEEAFRILAEYIQKENKKKLPYAERYLFDHPQDQDPDVIFLSFYIYLRGRELVAIRRWFGESGYSLNDLVEDAVQHVFGDMDIDILE